MAWGADGEETKQLRYLAVSLLCGMAHSTQRTRAELWAHNGLELLLQLLKEEVGYLWPSQPNVSDFPAVLLGLVVMA